MQDQAPVPARPEFTRPDDDAPASPTRHFRIPDHIFTAACERANDDGRRISAVVRDLLRAYARGEIDV